MKSLRKQVKPPSLWNQFDRNELQSLVDRHFGKQPPLSRWRLTLMLDSRGMTMMEYERCARKEGWRD